MGVPLSSRQVFAQGRQRLGCVGDVMLRVWEDEGMGYLASPESPSHEKLNQTSPHVRRYKQARGFSHHTCISPPNQARYAGLDNLLRVL